VTSFHAWIVLYLLSESTVVALCSKVLSYYFAVLHIDFLTNTRISLLPTHHVSVRRGRLAAVAEGGVLFLSITRSC
jgi:hypothetical protein